MATVNELITALGFKITPESEKNLMKVDNAISSITAIAGKMSKVFIGANSVMDYFTTTVMEEANEMVNLSKTTGYSIESLQKWKYAAEASGVSADSVVSDLETLRKQYLMNSEAVLLEADRLASMDKTTAMQWASRWGLSNDTFNLLRQGSAKIRDIMGEAYIIPGGKYEKTAEANRRFQAIKTNIRTIKDEIFMSLSPAVVDLTAKFGRWFDKNKEIISLKLQNVMEGTAKGFTKFGGIVEKVFEKLQKTGEALGIIDENTPAVETVSNIVAGGLLVMTSAAVISGLTKVLVFINTITFGLVNVKNIIGAIKFMISSGWAARGLVALTAKFLALYYAAKSIAEVLTDFATKGAQKSVDEWEHPKSIWEALNPAKAVAVAGGEAGKTIADWFNGQEWRERMDQARANYINNNQRVNMYFSTPSDAKTAMGELGFTPAMIETGAFGATNQ